MVIIGFAWSRSKSIETSGIGKNESRLIDSKTRPSIQQETIYK